MRIHTTFALFSIFQSQSFSCLISPMRWFNIKSLCSPHKLLGWILEIGSLVVFIPKRIVLIGCSVHSHFFWTFVFFKCFWLVESIARWSTGPCSNLSALNIWIEAHILRIWISLDLWIWIYVMQYKLSFAFVRARCNVTLHVLLSFNYFIWAVMAKVVVATLTQEHRVEISKTYWTIILKLVS